MNKFLAWMNAKKARLVVVAVALFALGAIVSQCANAAGAFSDNLAWELPTQRVDGTPLPVEEIAPISVEAVKDGVQVSILDYPPSILTAEYPRDLPPNYTMCYRAKTVDVDGLESEWTAEVCKIVRGNPNPPRLDNPR